LARFFLAVAYLIIGAFAVATSDTTTNTGLALGVAGSFTGLSGLIGLFTGPIMGAIVGGLSGMVAAATLPKKSSSSDGNRSA
jgi:L-lactate permease